MLAKRWYDHAMHAMQGGSGPGPPVAGPEVRGIGPRLQLPVQ